MPDYLTFSQPHPEKVYPSNKHNCQKDKQDAPHVSALQPLCHDKDFRQKNTNLSANHKRLVSHCGFSVHFL